MPTVLSWVLAGCATWIGAESRPASPPENATVAGYRPYRLFELILEADVVVSGEIVELQDEDFVLKVERRIVGETPAPSLRVRRFQDWTCGWRWEPYAIGQRVLLFLEKTNDGSAPFRILGDGCEGEMQVKAELVRLYTGLLVGDSEAPSASSNTLKGRTRVPLDQLDQAVRRLRAEVQWDTDPLAEWMKKKNLRPRVSLASLDAFAETSRLARNLCFETRASRRWSGPRSSPGYRIDARDLKTLDTEMDGFFLTVTLGDIDGDGVTDFATARRDAYSTGAVTIDFTNADGTTARSLEITSGEAGFVGDLVGGGDFGRSLCAPGDIDGDGVPDLLVGSNTGVWTLLLASDGTVKRHKKLEDGPRDIEDATHFGDRLAVLPRKDPSAPLKIACGGTRGSGEMQVALLWSLTLGPDGVLRAR